MAPRNPVAGDRNITVAIGDGAGALQGDVTVGTNGGSTATFTDLAISGAVGSRTLIFSSWGADAGGVELDQCDHRTGRGH